MAAADTSMRWLITGAPLEPPLWQPRQVASVRPAWSAGKAPTPAALWQLEQAAMPETE